MNVNPMAGKPADPASLISIAKLITAYYAGKPDISVPAQRVMFGTSGHRGCSLDNSFNEAHILAITQAICDYRKQQGFDGPMFIGLDTHALSEPAFSSAVEVLAGQRRRRNGGRGQRLHTHPSNLPRDPLLQSQSEDRPNRRHCCHAITQPAALRWFQIQSAAGRPR
jgi:Phosphoglucomutase/phosphomannomutase, alpha/beta/alpha domain I